MINEANRDWDKEVNGQEFLRMMKTSLYEMSRFFPAASTPN